MVMKHFRTSDVPSDSGYAFVTPAASPTPGPAPMRSLSSNLHLGVQGNCEQHGNDTLASLWLQPRAQNTFQTPQGSASRSYNMAHRVTRERTLGKVEDSKKPNNAAPFLAGIFTQNPEGSPSDSFLSPGLQGEQPPQLALTQEETRTKTLLNLFFDNAHGIRRNCADSAALASKEGDGWVSISWKEYGRLVCQIANGLRQCGFEAGDHAAILGSNSPRWLIADLAVMCLAGCTTGLYPNDLAEQVAFVCENFRAKVVFVDSEMQYAKLLDTAEMLGKLQLVVLMNDTTREVSPRCGRKPHWKNISWSELLKKGRRHFESAATNIERQARAILPSAICMTVYTSGTTGKPKGACYRHRNLYFIAEEISRCVGSNGGDITLSFLPLCHIAERIQGELLAIYDANAVYFAESFATVKNNLAEVRPTLFLCVPRVWEKFASALKQRFASEALLRRAVISQALRNGASIGECRNSIRGQRPAIWTTVQWRLYQKHIIGKILTQLGLDRCHTFASGAAPLNPEISRFFRSIGIDIAELYGQSESTGVIALTPKGAIKPGTAGLPLRGIQVVLGADGEILAKGDNVFAGYYNDARGTAQVIDNAGFLHTGDVGSFDEDGYLVVTDRLKDLIKTSGGKFIAPQPTEARLKTFDGIAQVVVIGDGKPYCTALITLDEGALPALTSKIGIESTESRPDILSRDKRIIDVIQHYIDEVNATLPSYATIKYFRILPTELTVEGGELTPTLKVKRRVVQEKYAHVIDEMYVSGERATAKASGNALRVAP